MSYSPRFPHHGVCDKLIQLLAFQLAVNAFAEDVAPQRFRFQINHHQAAIPNLSRNSECQLLPVYFSAIHDGVMAEVSPCGGKMRCANCVVDDFTIRAGEHIDRIRSRLTVDFDSHHKFVISDLVRDVARFEKRRIDDRLARVVLVTRL